MATPVEHLYESCTCDSGMRDGLRCADCGGRGIVPRGHTITGGTVTEPNADDGDELKQLSVKDLRAKAKELGLPSGGNKDALIAAIREATADAESDETDGDAADDGDDQDDTASS